MKKMGIDRPKVACLAANENVNPKIPSTVDARRRFRSISQPTLPLRESSKVRWPWMWRSAPKAARHKGLDSNVAGDVDLLVFQCRCRKHLEQIVIHSPALVWPTLFWARPTRLFWCPAPTPPRSNSLRCSSLSFGGAGTTDRQERI